MPELNSNPPISQFLSAAFARVLAWTERFVDSRWWVLKVFLLCVAFSILVSGGLDVHGFKHGYDWLPEYGYGYSPGYYLKIEHPLMDVAKVSAKNSHDANLNFRLTIPVILHVLGIRAHWVLPALAFASICGVIVVSCLFGWQATHDRVCALFLALGVASTYTGSFGFIAYFDSVAILQLAIAALPNLNWLARGLLVFTASFTDERALVASSLLLVGQLCAPGAAGDLRGRFFSRDFLAILGGMFGYAVGRIYLMKVVGLASPNGGTGPGFFIINMKFWHPVIWYSLEGGWLLVGLALIALWQRRQLAVGALFALAIAAMLGGALMIGDVLRSAVFVFPAVLVAVLVISGRDEPRIVRLYCFIACVVSIVGGNYDVFLDRITWFKPLPVEVLQRICHHIYVIVRPHFPGGPG